MSLLLPFFLTAAILVLAVGLYSIIVTRNLIRILISVEILVKAVTLLLIGVGYITGNMAVAQSYAVTIIIIEVVLLVIATGIVLGAYRHNDTLNTDKLNNLKG